MFYWKTPLNARRSLIHQVVESEKRRFFIRNQLLAVEHGRKTDRAHVPPTAPEPVAVIAYQQYIIVQSPTLLIRDWLAWSIVNLLLGGFLLGAIPLVFSIACRNQKFRGDLEGARTSSKTSPSDSTLRSRP